MAITYNPYNWEIRPSKEKLKYLESKREYLCDGLMHSNIHSDNHAFGYFLSKLVYVQEEIDKIYIRMDKNEKVYGGFQP